MLLCRQPARRLSKCGRPDAGTLRTVAFLRHSYSDTYYAGSRKAEFQGTTAGYYYFGTVLAYGFTERLTAETELGLFLDKRKKDPSLAPEQAWGLANGTVSLKYEAGAFSCSTGLKKMRKTISATSMATRS